MDKKEQMRRLLNKKGVGYFLYATDEVKAQFEGIFFIRGYLNLSLIHALLGN